MIKDIIIRSTEKNTTNGQHFLVHKAKMSDGNWIAVKFRKTVKNIPDEVGTHVMRIDTKNMNRTGSDFGDVYWVGGEPEAILPYEREDTACNDF